MAIPDGSRAGVTNMINIPATVNLIRSFRLDLRINHNEVGNLDIYLIPPWASWAGPYTLVQNEFSTPAEALNAPFPRGVLEISTDNGGTGNDFGSGGAPYTYARFSAAGDPVNPATQAIATGGVPYTANVYIPEGVDAFEDLYGRNPSGNWTIVVADDDTAGNNGTLVSWRITYAAVGAGTLYAHLGANNDPGLPIVNGAANQVMGQFRLDATAAANVTSIVFRESAATNLNGLLTATSLYRDNNGDGLLDGGDTLLNTAVPAASPNITFNFAQAIGAGANVDLLLVGTVAAAPAPVSMQMEIQTAASISSDIAEAGLFARRAGPRAFVSSTTFTYRPTQPDLITDNNDSGITRGITIPATSDRINSLRVGVRLNHTYTEDLDIYLLPPSVSWSPPYAIPDNGPVTSAPPGAIELSTDNDSGTGGNDYGADLTSTTYDYARFSGATDPTWAAAASISGASAPFIAADPYQPEGLSAWNLNYSADPSGNWRLIVVDSWGIDVGYLISWQIEYVAITTPQFWVVAGEDNTPGTPAFIGTAGNVLGQIKLESFNTNSTVSQIVVREQNGLSLTANLSALDLYQDNNADGLFDVGDTLLDAATLTATTATFALAPLSVPTGTSVRLLLVGTLQVAPANTTLALQLSTAADVSSVPAEIAPYAVQFGSHPILTPNTYVATPPGGLTIPANSGTGVTSTITIPATQDLIGALRVGIRIDHAADADLDIWLIPPGATWAGPYSTPNNGANPVPPPRVIELSTDNGGNGNNYGSGTTSFVYTIFSRNGDRQFNAPTAITAGAAPYTAGPYTPEITTNFDALYGTNPSGNWTLAVADDRGSFSGKLLSWFVQYVPAERAQVFSTPTAGFSDFGSLLVGTPSAAQGFRVQNMGNFSLTLPAPSAIAGIRITGTNAADFVIQGVAPSGVLAAGASTATFNIVFTPSGQYLRTASITVTWNNSDATMPPTSTSNYAIQGRGELPLIEVREADVSIGALVTNGQAAANGRAFGNQDIAAGPTTALTIFVKNTGVVPMTLGLPVLGGANPGDFVLNTAGYLVSVPAGSSTSFTVAFDPTVIGARAATVSFTHNASNTASPFTFALSGTGVQPTVTVASAGSPSEAGPTAGTFTITGAPAPSVARTVNFTMSGLANFAVGVDYNLSGTASYDGGTGQGTVTLGISGTAVITLTPVNEAVVEALESATLTLNAGTDYAIGAPSAATLNIADNDVATIAISNSGSPSEVPANGTYTISTLDTLEVALTINFTMSGVAVAADYALAGTAGFAFPNGSVTLGPGVAPSANVTLTPVNDAFVEGPETATMTVTAGTQYTGTPNTTLTIADNDTATVTVTSSGAPNESGPVNGTYTVTVTPQPRNAMSVNLSLTGAAQFGAGFDYTIAGAAITTPAGGSGPWVGTVAIPAGGGVSIGVIITLTTLDDARVEATELATLDATADTLLSDPAYSVGAPASASLSILDNDTASVSVTSTGTAAEPGTAATYTIQSASTLETPVTVTFTMSGVAANGVDYNLSGTGTLPVGTNTQAVITLTPVNDARVEATEDATLTLNAGAQVTVGAPSNATLNILDNDLATVTVSTSGTPTEAGSGSAIYTLSTTDILDVPVTVSFLMSGAASTTPGTDYNLSGSYTGPGGSAVLPVGTGTSVNVTLTPIDDARVEANEAATLTVQTTGQAQAGVPAAGTLNITDNDIAVITVTPAGTPGESGATGTYTVATAATLEIALTVNFTMSGAAVNADYALSGTASFAFPSGSVTLPIGPGSSAPVTLTPANDALVEGPEDATLTVTAGAQYSGTPFGTLTIADNDTVVITLSTLGSPSEAGPTAATFRVTATPQPAIAMSVNIALSGSATFGGAFDYSVAGATISTAPGGGGPWVGTVSIPGGGAGSTFVDITITPNDDARVEATESVILDVTADTLLTDPDYSGTPSDTLNITDNDTASVSVTSSGAVSEPGTGATYIIQSASTLDVPVTVTFNMSGSAQTSAGGDYNLSSAGGTFTGPGGTAILPVGTNTQIVVTLTPVNDAIVEATESATLTVLTAGQVTAASPTNAALNISDDDTATVNVSFAGSPSEAGPTNGTFTLATAATLEVALTVNFTMSGAASTVPGTDYNITSAGGTYTGPGGSAILPIGAAPSVIITIAPIDDVLVEGGETATLTISGGGQVVVGTALQTHSIADNDTPTVTISASGTPAEAGGGGTFTIATGATLAVPLTVNFTMSGLAFTTPGTDYTLAGFATYASPSGTVTLPAGAAPSVNVTFSVVNDAFVEGPESVIMTLNAGLYTVGGAGFDTLSIADNDTAVVTMTSSGSPHETGPVNGTYTIIVTPQPRHVMSVNISLSGTAQFGAAFDYAISGASISTAPGGSGPWLGTVSVPAGTGTSISVLVTLQTQDDAAAEPTESATLTVAADSVATDPAYSGTPSQSLNILDNDLPVVSVVGGPLSFGGAEIGTASAPQSYSVSAVNLTANLVITPPAQYEVALAAGGPWLSSLNLTPSSGTVASTSIFVRFAPTALGAAGGNVSNASAGAATQDVAVSGIGTGITVSAASLVFGNQLVGTASAAQTYTVQAEGLSANLLIGAPAGFELSNTGGAPWFTSLNLGSGTIAPTLISVRFAPAATGAAGGNVSNASTGFTTRNVAVSGNGIAGLLDISGTQNHGSVAITLSGASILYTVSNAAVGPFAGPLTVSSVFLGGANPGDFALSAFSLSLPTVLAPGASFTFLGTFTPLAQGVRNADIEVTSNTGGAPASMTPYAITGTGTPGLFAAAPTFPGPIDSGGPVVIRSVISAIANTVADVTVEYIGGAQASWTPATLVRTNAGTIAGNVISGMSVLAAGSTLEIYWDAYATERHVTASNYQIRFTPSNGTYGTGTTGTSAAFTLSRDGGWAQHVIPTDALTGRFGHVSVFDAANDRLIVFGGKIGSSQVNDTWAYNRSGYASGWHKLSPSGTQPSTRQYAAAIYDSANQRMLVFGGHNVSAGRMNQLWALSLTAGSEAWTQLAPTGTPAARYFHNLLLDASRNRAILFGGSGASGNLNDVWELDLGSLTWTQLAPAGVPPSPRYGAHAVIDTPRDRLVLFGGDTASGVANSQSFALSLAPGSETWTALAPATPSGAPSARYLGAHAYAANRESMLVESGYTSGGSFTVDSWLLDFAAGDSWTPLPADPVAAQGRVAGSSAYDAARGQLVQFGGINAGGSVQNSLCFLDTSAAPAWVLPPAPGGQETPEARWGNTLVFDSRYMPSGRLIMFGGRNPSNRFNDVWWIDPSAATPSWTRMTPTGTPPAPRLYASAVFDSTPGLERMIIFGGQSSSSSLNDVWALDLSTPGSESWSQIVVAGGPSARYLQAAAFDTAGQRLLVMGGLSGSSQNDVWQLSLSPTPAWTQLLVLAGSTPPVRYGHGAAYDSANNRLVIFMGRNAGNLADTWAFDLTAQTWANISAAGPVGRESAAYAVNATGSRAYVFGGYSTIELSDLWQLDIPAAGAVTWTLKTPAGGTPVARHASAACLDASGEMYVAMGYAGISINPGTADAWQTDPSAGTPVWSRIDLSTMPKGLVNSAEAFDTTNRRMLVFGGLLDGGLEGRLWQLDLASPIAVWSELSAGGTAPAARRGAKFVYDPAGNRLLMYGGYLGQATSSICNEIWQLSLGLGTETWTQLAIGGGPPALANCSMVYEPAGPSVLLFGGQLNTGGYSNALWQLSLSGAPSWSLLAAAGAPTARSGHSAIFDPLGNRMLVFGGFNGGVTSSQHAYNLGSNSWTLILASGPGARYYHSAVYDSTAGQERMLLFGGYGATALGDCWQLDLRVGFPLAWTSLSGTVAHPQPRWAHAAVFDSIGLRMVVAGGYLDGEIAAPSVDDPLRETWFYGR